MPQNRAFVQLDRRRQVAERYLHGSSQHEIARQLGCNQASVSRDLAVLRREWLVEASRSFAERQARELARLDELERQAWEGWERSLRDEEENVAEVVKAPLVVDGTLQDTTRTRTRRSTRAQAGDPSFLAEVRQCITLRLRLLGALAVDQPPTEATTRPLDWAQLYEKPVLDDAVQRRLEEARGAVITTTATTTNGTPPPGP